MKRGLVLLLALVLVGTVQAPANAEVETGRVKASAQVAQALSGSQFNPGLIISDALFYNELAMTQAQIQSFLVAKGSALATLRFNAASQPLSSDEDGIMCQPFTGGTNLLPSVIIYRAQVACDISAKVILVTLQKEQGLITKTSPTKVALDRAMGMACPDTAPCATYALGFANQIYRGARQLNTYKMSHFGRQPGVHSIAYHPSASCGNSTVNIRNYATAALYNYTPYRPNAAALANLYGTGDSCSSYGNRNFWRYYNDWFGSTLVGAADDAINTRHIELGGDTGPLGASTQTAACTSTTSCLRTFEHGNIYWTLASGAWTVTGEILTAYLASGGHTGPLGWPTIEAAAQEGGDHPTGRAQSFQKGSIYSSELGTFVTLSSVRSVYWSLGSTRGAFGWPTGHSTTITTTKNGTGVAQEFEAGGIYVGPGGSFSAASVFRDAYLTNGGPAGFLGWPTTAEAAQLGIDGRDGRAQSFQGGGIYSGPLGAFAVSTGIRNIYKAAQSTRGPLGWPIGDRTCTSLGCQQEFEGGTIYLPSSGSGYIVTGAILDAYDAAGGTGGALGWPRTNSALQVGGARGDGLAQSFANGGIYSGPPGAFPVLANIRAPYLRVSSTRGVLGWPVGAASPLSAGANGDGVVQLFQGGSVYAGGGSAHPMSGSILTAYVTSGGPAGVLGWPRTDAAVQRGGARGDGTAQSFKNGGIYSGPPGAFVVAGAIRTKYLAVKSTLSYLGWPVADAVCAGSTCSQQFQGGTLTG